MNRIRMTDRVSAVVSYIDDYDLTDDELAEFLTLEDPFEQETFLQNLPAGSAYETDTDIDHLESLETSFKSV